MKNKSPEQTLTSRLAQLNSSSWVSHRRKMKIKQAKISAAGSQRLQLAFVV